MMGFALPKTCLALDTSFFVDVNGAEEKSKGRTLSSLRLSCANILAFGRVCSVLFTFSAGRGFR